MLNTELNQPLRQTDVTRRFVVFNGFAGLGGNSLYWDDCEVIAVEENEKIADVYKKLHPNHTVIVGDAYEYFKNN